MKNNFGLVVVFLVGLLIAPAVHAQEVDPVEMIRSGALYDVVGSRYLGEAYEEYEADNPARNSARTLRLSLLSDRDPLLEARIGVGQMGFELRGSLRRSVTDDGTQVFSLDQRDRDGDG